MKKRKTKPNNSSSFEKLSYLAKCLRGENGCPWDKKQTIKSIFKCLESEIEEVRDAIKNKDNENLKEELGDVLFQIIMISQIAEEENLFDINDVIANIDKKIISRHTWVFGNDKAKTPEEALKLWNKNKKKE